MNTGSENVNVRGALGLGRDFDVREPARFFLAAILVRFRRTESNSPDNCRNDESLELIGNQN